MVSPGPTRRLINTYLNQPTITQHALEQFTQREIEVLTDICDGLTNPNIATRRNISLSTVKGHVTNLLNKTGAINRVGLVIWAFRHTSLNPGPED